MNMYDRISITIFKDNTSYQRDISHNATKLLIKRDFLNCNLTMLISSKRMGVERPFSDLNIWKLFNFIKYFTMLSNEDKTGEIW